MSSMPARPSTTARSSPAADACCASPRWATACAWRKAALTSLPTRSTSTAARCGATSATAPWTRKPANGAEPCPAFQPRQSVLNTALLSRLRAHLKQGGVIAYPTESCYGLGCDPRNRRAVMKMLRLKGRPQHKGLILIGADFSQLQPYVAPLSDEQWRKISPTWPGPVTWLLPAARTHPRLAARQTSQHCRARDRASPGRTSVPGARHGAGFDQRQPQRADARHAATRNACVCSATRFLRFQAGSAGASGPPPSGTC